MADGIEPQHERQTEADETQRRFEELRRKQALQRRLRLVLWLLPLALALLLLIVAKDEETIVSEGVRDAPAIVGLREDLGDAKDNLEKLGSTLGDPVALPPASAGSEGTPATGRPRTVVDVLDFHAARLDGIEGRLKAAPPPPAPATPAPTPVFVDEGAEEVHAALSLEIEGSRRQLAKITREVESLSSSAERAKRLNERLEAATGSLEDLRKRLERLEHEAAYRSLTVREGEIATVLTLGLRISPGQVRSDDTLPTFAITTRDGARLIPHRELVALGKENSFDHDGCSFSFSVTRHKRSWLFSDYLDIELLRSCKPSSVGTAGESGPA